MRIIIEIDPDTKAQTKKIVSGGDDMSDPSTSASNAINAGLANIPQADVPMVPAPQEDSMESMAAGRDTRGISAGGFSNSSGNDDSSSAQVETGISTSSGSGMNAGIAKPAEGANTEMFGQQQGDLSSIDKANAIDAGGFRGEGSAEV